MTIDLPRSHHQSKNQILLYQFYLKIYQGQKNLLLARSYFAYIRQGDLFLPG